MQAIDELHGKVVGEASLEVRSAEADVTQRSSGGGLSAAADGKADRMRGSKRARERERGREREREAEETETDTQTLTQNRPESCPGEQGKFRATTCTCAISRQTGRSRSGRLLAPLLQLCGACAG